MKKLTLSDIERMSEEQLRLAGKFYHIANYNTVSVADLEAALKKTVNSSVPEKPEKAASPGEREKPDERKRVWFKLLPDQRIGGDAPVFAALQGNSIMVHRNAWVPLPSKYMPCFRDAVETVVTTLKDGSTKTSDVPRYNYQVKPLVDIDTPPDEGMIEAGF